MEIDTRKISLYTKDGITYIKFKKLEEYKNIEHAFCISKNLNFKTRDKDGNIYPYNIKNYEIFLKLFNLNYKNVVKPIFKHSTNYKIVEKKYNHNYPDICLDEYFNIDALITDKKDYILAATSADCNIILIYDTKNNVITNVHSGWLGTLNGIVINTINGMIEKYNSNPNDLICCLCPSIRLCHFEVGEDVYNRFKDKYKDLKYYKFINNKWHIDLVGIIKDNLVSIGVNIDNIIDSNICNMCNSSIMHSYRADYPDSGLNMGFICIKESSYDR